MWGPEEKVLANSFPGIRVCLVDGIVGNAIDWATEVTETYLVFIGQHFTKFGKFSLSLKKLKTTWEKQSLSEFLVQRKLKIIYLINSCFGTISL